MKSSWSHAPASFRPYGGCHTNPSGPNNGKFWWSFLSRRTDSGAFGRGIAAHGADESLGQRIRTRGQDWRFADPDAFGVEHLVEAGRELGVSFSDEEFGRVNPLGQDEAEIAGRDPLPYWVGRDAGDLDPPRQ